MRGIPTGFQDLDTLTGGLQGADLVIVATPSSGINRSLALNMALHVATISPHGVGLLCLDMNKRHVMQQLLAMRTGIDLHHLRTGWITDEERALVIATARTLSKASLWIDDTAGPTLAQLRQRAQQLIEEHHVALIVVDNIHLIQLNAQRIGWANQAQEVGEIRHNLKTFAQEFNIPVLVGAPIAHMLTLRRLQRPHRSDSPKNTLDTEVDHILFLYRDAGFETAAERNSTDTVTIITAGHKRGEITAMENFVQLRQVYFRNPKNPGTSFSRKVK